MKKFNVVYYTLHYMTLMNLSTSVTAQKMKFSIKDFFSKNDQIFNGKPILFVQCVCSLRLANSQNIRAG